MYPSTFRLLLIKWWSAKDIQCDDPLFVDRKIGEMRSYKTLQSWHQQYDEKELHLIIWGMNSNERSNFSSRPYAVRFNIAS